VRDHPNPVGWVILAALNSLRSTWRRRRREVPGEVPDREQTPYASAHLSHNLRGAILALPRRQREVIALRLIADVSRTRRRESCA
jgi:RNA polymerase sigma-70 factor (ECF subfamily)